MGEHPAKYEALLEAAKAIIEEDGFDQTSVSKVTERAGTAKGTFYLYFQSKKELVPAIAQQILEEQLARIQEAAGEEPERRQLLESMIRVTFAMTKQYKTLITFCYAGISLYYSFERWEALYEPYNRWLSGAFARLQEEGNVMDELEPMQLVHYTIGLVEHGAEGHILSRAVEQTEDEAVSRLLLITDKMIRPSK
ncbi:TetR/AcrR family transcriptional regulator [Alkalicoccus chagannorensis]|uniref:TetR/AcrR family transcriptional regulator n=1 Tax=Alkalicoccus chagannorensis TaxID=427072 RepID=UPI0004184071|nr:TetR family transcriptional regulator [Alkalicoccus chagannorensis]